MEMNCCVCYNHFTEEPLVFFQCDHVNICDECIDGIIEAQRNNPEWRLQIRCPLCRAYLKNADMVAELNLLDLTTL